jgi:hypothetical protein
MKRKIPIVLSLLLAVFSSSCEKRGAMVSEDREAPLIEVLAPLKSDFSPGDTLPISIRFIENDELHDFYIGLNDRTGARKLIHYSRHRHLRDLQVDTSFVLPLGDYSAHYELQLQASDHSGNKRELRKGIFIYPQAH